MDYGKISYYASFQNDITDANGYYNNILIGGSDITISPDLSGPEIDLFMNNENFVTGGITDENPRILAYVSDPNGINTVGSGIGHDIIGIIDGDNNNLLILNDFYEADIGSYKSGKIEYPLFNITPGQHNLMVKIWDIFNNSSEANIEFIVVPSSQLTINNLYNYPNPFKESTVFYFYHNQQNSKLHVKIDIFSVSGSLIKTIEKDIISDGFSSGPIVWNGNSDSGYKIRPGIYIYSLTVKTADGSKANKFGKLIILK
jgi:hypothetical protein